MKTIPLATTALLAIATAFGGPALAGDMSKSTGAGSSDSAVSTSTSTAATSSTGASATNLDSGEVTAVQKALNEAGHDVAVDGTWGQQTARAVMDYQTSNGLPASGEVDARTATALGIALEGTVRSRTDDMPDTGTGTGMDADSETGVMAAPGPTDLTD